MILDPNPLYYWMAKTYYQNKTINNKVVIFNEGGFRSGKTCDTADLIFTFCDHNRKRNMPLEIGVFRNTLKDCRERTYEMDFKKQLQRAGLYHTATIIKENASPEVTLWGSKISFRGLDDMTEAPTYDIVFINEMMEIDSYEKVRGLIGKCTKLVIGDWNPKFTNHWVFDWEGRPGVFFSHTTYRNNKHLDPAIISGLEATSPWNLEDLHLPEDQRRPHYENIQYNTADKWHFLVYGMGIRASRDGLVFPNVTYINLHDLPTDIEQHGYGCDFGTTAESAISKVMARQREKVPDLFLQNLFYAPTENSNVLIPVVKEVIPDYTAKYLHCDNNKPGWIEDMRNAGINAIPTVKFDGSRDYWIQTIKKFNIHIINDPKFQKEQENFSYRMLDGIQLSETVKKYDHLFSASGYGVVGDLLGFCRG